AVTGDVVQGALAAYIFASLANHDDQLAFVIQLIGARRRWNQNRVAGMLQSVHGFHKGDRILSRAHSDFSSVRAIILADAPDGDRSDGSQDLANAGGFLCQRMFAEWFAFDSNIRAGLAFGGILEFSILVLVANDFHGDGIGTSK